MNPGSAVDCVPGVVAVAWVRQKYIFGMKLTARWFLVPPLVLIDTEVAFLVVKLQLNLTIKA